MKCACCQGEMKKSFAPLHIDRNGFHVTLDQVPAWVCGQCGEAWFEETESDAIQTLIESVEEKSKTLFKKAG